MKTASNLRILLTLIMLSPLLSSCSGVVKSLSTHRSEWKQKQLLITYSCSAPAEERNVARAAAENFNTIPAAEEALKFAANHKMKVILEHGTLLPATIHSPEKLKQLDQLIARVKNNPALEAYYITDEPQANAFPEIAELVAHIRKLDPKHLSFINLLPIYGVPGEIGQDPSRTYMKYLNQYIETVKPDLLSYDYYNFLRDRSGLATDGPVYFVNLALVRQAAMKAQIPFMNIVQASDFEPNWRRPNADEMRWQIYTTLAYGGRGISYFLYWGPQAYRGIYQDGKPTELIKPISKLNKEMSALSPILMSKESIDVFHTSPLPVGTTPIPADCPVQITSQEEFILGLFGKSGRADSFMIVNRNYKDQATAKVSIQGKQLIQEFNRDTSSWENFPSNADGNFIINLQPGDGRLFRYKI